MAACLWLVTQAENAGVAVGLITLTISLSGMNFPAFWSLPMDMNVRKAGLITGMMNTGSALASIVAPGVTGDRGHVVWLDGRPRARVGPCLALGNRHVAHGAEIHFKTGQGMKIHLIGKILIIFPSYAFW